MMKEEDLYTLLEEITGIQRFQAKKMESLKMLDELNKDKQKIREILDEIRLKIEDLQSEKETYENYEKKENTAKM